MRVLVVANNFPSPEFPQDGIFVLRQLQALRERNHEFRVVRAVPMLPTWVSRRWRRYTSVPATYCYDDIRVDTLRTIFLPKNRSIEWLPLQLGGAMARLIEEFDPHVIHAQGLLYSGALAIDHARPVLVTAHGSDAYDLPWRRAGVERKARCVAMRAHMAAVSEFVAGHLRALGARHVDVIFNGADEKVFFPRDRSAARRELGLDPLRPVVAFAAHLEHAKGIQDLIPAVAALGDLKPVLVLAGGGVHEQLARDAAAVSNIDARFVGRLDHEALATLFAAADVFALPSYREGLPTVLCEVMLSGRALVASDVGGIPEIVRDGENGFVVSPGDRVQLAEALRRVLRDGALRSRFEQAGRAFAFEHLTWARNAARYDDLYHGIAGFPNRLRSAVS